MDRRKIKGRHGLHKIQTAPGTSDEAESEDIFSSNYQADRMSQRASNTELLRKQTNISSPSTSDNNDDIDNQNNDKLSQSPVAQSTQNRAADSPIKARKRIISESSSQSTQFSTPVKRRHLDEPSTSKVRKSTSPPGRSPATTNIIKKDIKIRPQRQAVIQNNVQSTVELVNLFTQVGITLDENDSQYLIANDPLIVAKKIQQFLTSGDFQKQMIIEQWNNYIQDEDQLNKLLSPTILNSSEGRQIGSFNSISVVKIMLQVPCIQTEILGSLLNKLNETVVAADSMENVPWTYQLLQQLRFLETIYDPDVLTIKFEELLETCPMWFQRELIAFIPDIAIDTQHQNIAEILVRLMEVHKDLTMVILTCITNLSLGKEYLEELREKMLRILQDNCHITKIPVIVKFCLEDCSSAEIYQNVLRVIRNLDLEPLSGENPEEYYSSQVMIVNTLKTMLVLSKDLAKAAIMILELTDNVPKPFDLIILLLLHEGVAKKKKTDAILKQHVKSGFYRISLLNDFYSNYREIAKDLHSAALSMASNLLKSENRVLTDFTTGWFRLQFLINGELVHKQREIVEKLIALMGNNDQTAKSSLIILCKMTEKKEERRYLQTHCNYLRILLEKMEKFGLKEVTMLNDLLHALCATSHSASDTLKDDLFILLQKQLFCNDSVMKSKGVAGAVMAIKHLATSSKYCETALNLFNKVYSGTKNCPRSRGFFYDTLSQIIADTDSINDEFLNKITQVIENEFIEVYMVSTNDYSGDLTPSFELNHFKNESQSCVVNFSQPKYGGIIVALLKLMKVCLSRIHSGDLTTINALLGSGILMPKDLDMPNTQTLDLMFHCINWYRELINTFVTQRDPLLRKQVSKRLENTMYLQGELSNLLSLAENRYQPPVCYFDSFSSVSFNKIEKKSTKKGKKSKDTEEKTEKSINVPEWESWEKGSLLSTKNPLYFRRLDADILDLLDNNEDPESTENFNATENIPTGQVCFIIKELLAVFDGESVNYIFMKDLMQKLPKICAKLQNIVRKLKENEDQQHKYALRLILSLITTIFQWKGFDHPAHNVLLRDGLRILASQVDESNRGLRSCKDLVSESYRFFESLAEVATQIQLAASLVETCKVLMKHSETFTRQNKSKQANMAFGFLSLKWPLDRNVGPLFKSSVTSLLQNWMDHEPHPLETVTSILEWLPEEVKTLETSQDYISKLPPINKLNFHYLYAKIFDGLIKGIKISFQSARPSLAKVQLWREVAENLQQLVFICKSMTRKRSILLVYVRKMPGLLKLFLIHAMPVLEQSLRHQPDEITKILKLMQAATRYLNVICVDSTEKKDIALTRYVPAAKSILEQLIYRVKGMLVLNNSSTAFWMGNLVNKNLEGQEICSQASTSTDEPTMQDVNNSNENASGDEILSDVLDDDNDSNNDDDISIDES
ncbi:Fanconi anemia group D2 protein [Chelonus insularis]|uniref:Fanconi anemia group D2 protein n=1 Tax=Chelonus insularis TaxID=460826 RepID=UPI00158A15B9|nr:Fanconi anemia group D2 protein [Chelonus insularis]XP_034937748.1 Fanconi anemia group D2 protein [Chelonus insularis]XP_034937749.1 Fanconi anemia group D2 protein [Chelonus insularis]XP_034937750.1 Fanconi anemia group D2 protein [Chelonus insularis]